MTLDFDTPINRMGTNSVKWEFKAEEGMRLQHWPDADPALGEEAVLPLWVADMDFRCPEPVIDALQARVAHGLFGYSEKTTSYLQSIVDWMENRHCWSIDKDWVLPTSGVVPDLYSLVRELIEPGDGVLIQTPVYYPFFGAIRHGGGEMVVNPLRYIDGRYEMDFEDLEVKLSTAHSKRQPVRVAILCNPHNPVGRVWSSQELARFAELCAKHDVMVIADEVHGDLILPGHRFTPFASLAETSSTRRITCTAPSKTFNLAGLQTSNLIIDDPELRQTIATARGRSGLFGMNTLGIVATEAAYRYGAPWLDALLEYVQANVDFLETFVSERIPELRVIRPEGTYLVWLDCRGLGLDDDSLEQKLLGEARLYLDAGILFGSQGSQFQRINVACPRCVLDAALCRMERVMHHG